MGILNTTVNVKDIKREATLTAQLAIDATDEKIFRTLSKDARAHEILRSSENNN
jgi:hypothetical protein